MAEPTWGLRPKVGELDLWRAAAVSAGKPFNTWLRDALNAVARLEEAHRRQTLAERVDASVVVAAVPRSASVRGRASMCEHRVPAGAFCSRCGS